MSGAVATEGEVPAVEHFSYPDADRIYAEQGVRLLRGNGQILLAECADTPESAATQVKVLTSSSLTAVEVCFQVKGAGFVTLELQDVFSVKGAARLVTATVVEDNVALNVKVPAGEWVQVGAASDPAVTTSVLVELRATA
jgi:hypothetical protein